MRLLGLTVLLILIQISIGIFYNTTNDNSVFLTPFGEDAEANRLWSFIMTPVAWTESGMWVLISGLIIVGSGIAIGTIFGAKSDLTYLFVLFLFFSAFGAIPIANLYLVITSEVGAFACETGEVCSTAIIIAFLFSGILAASWIYSCLEWWSGRPAT